MAIGTWSEHAGEPWIPTGTVALPVDDSFYNRLNQPLSEHDFCRFVEEKSRRFYAAS
jgi:hypothetical protein